MIAPAPPPPPPLFLPHCTSPPPAEPVCWQALRAAPDGRTAGLAPEERAYQLALYSDLREAGTGCLPPGIEGFDNRTVEGKFVLQVLPWRRAAPSIGGVSAPPMGCGASPHLVRSSGRAGSRPGRRAAPGGVHAARLLSAAISLSIIYLLYLFAAKMPRLPAPSCTHARTDMRLIAADNG